MLKTCKLRNLVNHIHLNNVLKKTFTANKSLTKYRVNVIFFFIMCVSLCSLLASCGVSGGSSKRYRSANIDYKKAALLNVELGRHYLAQGYTERAKKKFLHALELMPSLAEAHSGIGYFWETVGEYQEAEKHYKKSIYLGKGNGEFYNQYAVFLCHNDCYKKADQYFMLAINDKRYTKTADVYSNAGLCALKAKNDQQALKYFTKSLHHDPRKIELLLDLAKIYISRQELLLAKQQLDQFYQKNLKPTAEYLLLRIKWAKIAQQEQEIAGYALLLKNLFPNSVEYDTYQKEYLS
jgi:type IV pilus assembly protein PilF